MLGFFVVVLFFFFYPEIGVDMSINVFFRSCTY